MGKRRLRFDQRKNHERLKYAPKSLTVSVPLSNSVMAFRVSLPLRYSSLCTTSPATNIATLHARIVACEVLSPGWTILLLPQSLTLCQLCCKPPHTDTVVSFSVTIASDFSWSLTLYGHTIEVVGTDVLHGIPVILSSVKGVCTVISALQESSVCIGNVEQKYITLIEHNKGSMKSSSGTVKMRMFSNQINPFNSKFNFTPCRLHPFSSLNLHERV